MTVVDHEISNPTELEEKASTVITESPVSNSTVLQDEKGTCPSGCPCSCLLIPCEICAYCSLAFPILWPVCCPILAFMIPASTLCP